MDITLWIAQILLALAFTALGIAHITQYDKLVAEERSASLAVVGRQRLAVLGVLEILGAIGLVVPAVTGILPWLTPLAALGLAIIVFGAAAFHLRNVVRLDRRAEAPNVVITTVLGLIATFVAVGRTAIEPLV
jgi:uncharacterized membrane protein